MIHFLNFTKEMLDNMFIQNVNTNKKISYLNIPCALDIETTSMIIKGEKFAFSYIWQFGIGLETVVYGRTLDELVFFLNDVSEWTIIEHIAIITMINADIAAIITAISVFLLFISRLLCPMYHER